MRFVMRRSWAQMRSLVIPGAIIALGLVVWEELVQALAIPKYILPLPSQVAAYIVENWQLLLPHAGISLFETIGGFLLGVVIGIPLAAAIVWSRTVDDAVMPFLIISQTFPKVALAPLLLLWLGFGLSLKIVVSFLVAFFPIVISAVAGMRSVESEMLELARSMKAGGIQTFLKIRLPWALPQIFAGMKVAIAFALVGAIVGEWVGADRGLGYLLIWANNNLDTEIMFAVFLFLAAIGAGLYYLICMIERISIPWHVSIRERRRHDGHAMTL